MNTVECPYCEYDNDMTDALLSDLSSNNTFDWECQKCEKEFEVCVEFEPYFNTSKIEYEKCDDCGELVREICKRKSTFPFPKNIDLNQLCDYCFRKNLYEEYEDESKQKYILNDISSICFYNNNDVKIFETKVPTDSITIIKK